MLKELLAEANKMIRHSRQKEEETLLRRGVKKQRMEESKRCRSR